MQTPQQMLEQQTPPIEKKESFFKSRLNKILLGALLTVSVLCVSLLTVWFFWQKTPYSEEEYVPPPTPDPTLSWNTYQNSQMNFSLRLPEGWATGQTATTSQGGQITSLENPAGRITLQTEPALVPFVQYVQNVFESSPFDSRAQKENVVVGKTGGIRISNQGNSEIIVITDYGQLRYLISLEAEDSSLVVIFDLIVSSFEFTD